MQLITDHQLEPLLKAVQTSIVDHDFEEGSCSLLISCVLFPWLFSNSFAVDLFGQCELQGRTDTADYNTFKKTAGGDRCVYPDLLPRAPYKPSPGRAAYTAVELHDLRYLQSASTKEKRSRFARSIPRHLCLVPLLEKTNLTLLHVSGARDFDDLVKGAHLIAMNRVPVLVR